MQTPVRTPPKSVVTWVLALTWCVAFAVDLCRYGHLSEVAVPRSRHLIFGSSLRCLKVIKQSERVAQNIWGKDKASTATMAKSKLRAAHQQGWCVDVDGLDDRELFLDFPDGGPRPVQLNFHPVTDAAVLPLEGGDERLFWKLEAEWKLVSAGRKDGHFTIIWRRKSLEKTLQVILFIFGSVWFIWSLGLKVRDWKICSWITSIFLLVSHGL